MKRLISDRRERQAARQLIEYREGLLERVRGDVALLRGGLRPTTSPRQRSLRRLGLRYGYVYCGRPGLEPVVERRTQRIIRLTQYVRDAHGDWVRFLDREARREAAEREARLVVALVDVFERMPPTAPRAVFRATPRELHQQLSSTPETFTEDEVAELLRGLSQRVGVVLRGKGKHPAFWRKPFLRLRNGAYLFDPVALVIQDLGHALVDAQRGCLSNDGDEARRLGESIEYSFLSQLSSRKWTTQVPPADRHGKGDVDLLLSDATARLAIQIKARAPTLSDRGVDPIRRQQLTASERQLSGLEGFTAKWFVTFSAVDIGQRYPGGVDVVDGFWLLGVLRQDHCTTVGGLLECYAHQFRGGPKPEADPEPSHFDQLISGDLAEIDTDAWDRHVAAQPRPVVLCAA